MTRSALPLAAAAAAIFAGAAPAQELSFGGIRSDSSVIVSPFGVAETEAAAEMPTDGFFAIDATAPVAVLQATAAPARQPVFRQTPARSSSRPAAPAPSTKSIQPSWIIGVYR